MQFNGLTQIILRRSVRNVAIIAGVWMAQMGSASTATPAEVPKILPEIVSGLGSLTPGRTVKCDTAGAVQQKDIVFTCTEQLQGRALNTFLVKFSPAIYFGYTAKIEFNYPGAAPTDQSITDFLKLSQEKIRVAYNSFREFPDAENFTYSFYDGTFDHLEWRQGAVVYNSEQNYGLVFQVSIGKEYDGKSKTIAIYVGVVG